MATIARACLQNRIAAVVSVVISDRPGVAGITTAQDLGIETHVVSWKSAADRAAFELTPTLTPLAAFREQLLVLSGLNCIPTPGRPGGGASPGNSP